MGHRGPSEGEPDGHFSHAEHADEWAESLEIKSSLLQSLQESGARHKFNSMPIQQRVAFAFKTLKSAHPKKPHYLLYQNAQMQAGVASDERMRLAKTRYFAAKDTKVGNEFVCPGCSASVVKRTYQHTYCGIKTPGYSNCKDFINNWINPVRLQRTLARTSKEQCSIMEVPANTSDMSSVPVITVQQWLASGAISREQLTAILNGGNS
jgi:hypothetical protein